MVGNMTRSVLPWRSESLSRGVTPRVLNVPGVLHNPCLATAAAHRLVAHVQAHVGLAGRSVGRYPRLVNLVRETRACAAKIDPGCFRFRCLDRQQTAPRAGRAGFWGGNPWLIGDRVFSTSATWWGSVWSGEKRRRKKEEKNTRLKSKSSACIQIKCDVSVSGCWDYVSP